MSSFLNNLLAQREEQGRAIKPLWKLNIEEEEFNGLKEEVIKSLKLYEADNVSNQTITTLANKIGPDLCILIAYWWKNLYDGKDCSYDGILRKVGIACNRKEQIQKVIYFELSEKRTLDIDLHRSPSGRNLYKTSLFAQGGFPRGLNSLFGETRFADYMVQIIKYQDDIDGMTDKEFAKSIQCHYFNALAFRNNDSIAESCLSIARLYCDFKEGITVPEEYMNIFKAIDERLNRRDNRELTYFKVEWGLNYDDNQVKVFYKPVSPRFLSQQQLAVRSQSLQFAINEEIISEYYLDNSDEPQFCRFNPAENWRGFSEAQQELRLQYCDDNYEIRDYKLSKSSNPFGEIPVLLKYEDGKWVHKRGSAAEDMLCMMPKGWSSSIVPEVKISSKLFGKEVILFRFRWDDASGEELVFKNEEQTISYNRQDNVYDISFYYSSINSIVSSSLPICVNVGDFSTKVSIRDNFGLPCSRMRGLEFYYKKNNERYYNRYEGGYLPNGIITFMVRCPNGVETFRFFNIKNIQFDIVDTAGYQYAVEEGHLCPLSGQPVEITDGRIRIVDDNYIDDIKLRLFANGIVDYVDINIKNPCDRSCFLDSDGCVVPDGTEIAVTELYKYRIHVSGSNKNLIMTLYSPYDPMPRMYERLEKKFRISGMTPNLENYRPYVDRAFTLFDPVGCGRYVELKIGNSKLHVRYYKTILTQEGEGEETKIYATIGDERVESSNLVAISTEALPGSEAFLKLFDLTYVEGCDGEVGYCKLMDVPSGCRRFIVFSRDTYSRTRPLFLNFNANFDRENRVLLKENGIDDQIEKLEQGDINSWEQLWWHFKLIVDYNLHFTAFHCMNALARSIKIQAYFIANIYKSPIPNNYPNELTVTHELERMERELGISFHTLPRDILAQYLNPDIEGTSRYLFALLSNLFCNDVTASMFLLKILQHAILLPSTVEGGNIVDNTPLEYDFIRFDQRWGKGNATAIMQQAIRKVPIKAARYQKTEEEALSAEGLRLINYFRYYCQATYNYYLINEFNR